MLKIENPEKLQTTMKALTAGVNFELVYQRENPHEYLFRILKDGVLDCKMSISKNWKPGDTIVVQFCDKDNHWILSTYELEFSRVRNRGEFLLWITDKFINGYK